MQCFAMAQVMQLTLNALVMLQSKEYIDEIKNLLNDKSVCWTTYSKNEGEKTVRVCDEVEKILKDWKVK